MPTSRKPTERVLGRRLRGRLGPVDAWPRGPDGPSPRDSAPGGRAPAPGQPLAWLAPLAGLLAAGCGCLALAFWSTGYAAPAGGSPGWATLFPRAALAVVLAGASLALVARPHVGAQARLAAAALGVIVLALGPMGLSASAAPMFGLAALAHALVGADLVLLAWRPTAGRHLVRASEVAAGLIAFAAVLGFAYGLGPAYAPSRTSIMAAATAFATLVLLAGLVAARPAWPPMSLLVAGGIPAMLLRRLLAFAIAAPAALGSVLLASEAAGWLPREVAMTAMILAAVLGGVVLVSWTALNVARHEAARGRALALERELAAIVTASDDAIVSGSLTGTVRTWNAGAERLYGYTHDEMVGCSALVLVPPEREAEQAGLLARVARGEHVVRVETVRRRKDGSVVPVSLSLTPLYDAAGALAGVASISRDVSAARFAADALRESRQRLEAIVDNTPALIAITDLEGRLVLINRQLEIFAGRPRATLLGQGVTAIFPPEAVASVQAHDQAALAARAPLDFEEVLSVRGDERTFLAVRFPLAGLDCTPYAVGAVLTDITERKRGIVEAARREAAAREALQVAALKEALLSAFSHEIKTPLAIMMGNAELIGDQYPGDPLAEALLDGARRLAAQVARLLDLSALLSGGMPLYLAPIDARELVAQLRAEVGRKLEAADIELEANVAPDLPAFAADERRVLQALVELVENALANVPRGGSVRVSVDRAGDEVCLCVHDGGPGIAAGRLAAIWEAYAKLKDGNVPYLGGLGIGLTLVKLIATRHGGRVEVSNGGHGDASVPCCGSGLGGACMRIYLPLVPGTP